MLNRRAFIQATIAAAAAPTTAAATSSPTFGPLRADRRRVLDLPAGFEYRIISKQGSEMSDGLLVPGFADGMAAFAAADGNVRLVCNHELDATQASVGAFGRNHERFTDNVRDNIYDAGGTQTPALGGTTTIVYDPASGQAVRQFLSLAGTEYNCAGGPTPWGTWLSCEEAFADEGPAWVWDNPVVREKRHGYIFEVSAHADGLVKPQPLIEMGRFEHEAAAVDPATGDVYLTEDRHRSLFYRFRPHAHGELHRGGTLQALAVVGKPKFDTRNWTRTPAMRPGEWFEATWLDVDEPDVDSNNLRIVGYKQGAARFARGEGICYADGSLFITCTIGGKYYLGQIFEYRIKDSAIRLLCESQRDSVLRNCDNITMSPWGDLVVCEDTADHCGLVGVRLDGSSYPIADNAYTSSELAGICFSPDGETMFVNIQERGLTLAINGPWESLDA